MGVCLFLRWEIARRTHGLSWVHASNVRKRMDRKGGEARRRCDALPRLRVRKRQIPVASTIKERRIGYKKLCRFCVFYCFLGVFLPFRGIKNIFFDRRSPSSESFCAFGGWAFLLALNLWVIVKILVIVKMIVCGRYLVLKKGLLYDK